VAPEATAQDCLLRLRRKGFEHTTVNSTRRLHDAQQQRNNKGLVDEILEQKNQDLEKKRKFLKKSEFPLEK
jgi:hypothetical protein